LWRSPSRSHRAKRVGHHGYPDTSHHYCSCCPPWRRRLVRPGTLVLGGGQGARRGSCWNLMTWLRAASCYPIMQRRLTIGISGAIPPALLDVLLPGKGVLRRARVILDPFAPVMRRNRTSKQSRRESYAVAGRKRCQFRNDRHALAFERRASGKVAGQRCRERFRTGEDGACGGCVPRLLAPPVPCRAADACRKPRALCGPSRSYPVRPSPTL